MDNFHTPLSDHLALDDLDGFSSSYDNMAQSPGASSVLWDASDTSAQMLYAARARRLLKARRALDLMMPKKLFRDSAWDVLLELYIGAVEESDVYVKQAIIASGECPATAMRIIARLESFGLLSRKGDDSDQRRVVVSLTRSGQVAIELLLEQFNGDPAERTEALPMGTRALNLDMTRR